MAHEVLGLAPGRRVLELGCGAGDFSMRLARSGADVVAVDIASRLIELARRRCDAENLIFDVANVESLPFEDRTFDAVTGNAILHHLELGPVCREVIRVLRPGGRIFFTEPNMLNPQVWLERNVKFIGRWLQNSPEETAFVRWSLAKRLRRAGFVEVSAVPFDFLHPATPESWIPRIVRASAVLERVPGLREIAGSLRVSARKPS
jgi:ubiquinone/menaquinone biosynthesis C-methylase UbiE